MTDEEVSDAVREVAGLCKKHGLKLKNRKTIVDKSNQPSSDFFVTGVLTRHGAPKLPKKERRFIRQLVHTAELEYERNNTAPEYHELWNRASGKTAKLKRLGYKQARQLRHKLAQILPELSDDDVRQLVREVDELCDRRNAAKISRIAHLKRVNRVYHRISLLSRSNKGFAKHLRNRMNYFYGSRPAMVDYWER